MNSQNHKCQGEHEAMYGGWSWGNYYKSSYLSEHKTFCSLLLIDWIANYLSELVKPDTMKLPINTSRFMVFFHLVLHFYDPNPIRGFYIYITFIFPVFVTFYTEILSCKHMYSLMLSLAYTYHFNLFLNSIVMMWLRFKPLYTITIEKRCVLCTVLI